MTEGNNKNFLIALALSLLVFAVWQYFVATPQMEAERARQAALSKQTTAQGASKPAPAAPGMQGPAAPATAMTRNAALKAGGARVAIDAPMVDGSIRLTGGLIDDLRLKNYHETINPKSDEIVLLAPKSTAYPYHAEFGWVAQGVRTPDDQSVWTQVSGTTLSPGKPVTLSWDNGQGQVFTRVIAIDDKYMFTVADSVRNNSGREVTLYPYGAVERENAPLHEGNFILHTGFVGVANGSQQDAAYSDFKEAGTPPVTFSSTGGWAGITDKYWMAAVIPPQNENFDGQYLGSHTAGGTPAYQANYRLGARRLAPNANATVTHRLFAGAKVVNILQEYEERQQIAMFTNAVDWGWFWFLTRPFFSLLDWFNQLLGNFGLAILALTVAVKIVFFPLANASFRAMGKMKKLQPEMERLKKEHSEDPQKFQLAMMELYKREKANPIAGCVPILLTIPVFFALYKVLFVTIEMRHAPFYGWIQDLSAPDPTSYINLFGLLPFNPHTTLPSFLMFLSLGVWPMLYGITMWVQQKLNPAPTDPVQAKMFAWMPFIFTFFFGTFPAGLVIYYTWNNILTIIQQWIIMRREGVEIHLFENLGRKKPPANDG
jgi:YidC/Oxa1 family membrane protein insertase